MDRKEVTADVPEVQWAPSGSYVVQCLFGQLATSTFRYGLPSPTTPQASEMLAPPMMYCLQLMAVKYLVGGRIRSEGRNGQPYKSAMSEHQS